MSNNPTPSAPQKQIEAAPGGGGEEGGERGYGRLTSLLLLPPGPQQDCELFPEVCMLNMAKESTVISPSENWAIQLAFSL